MKTRLLMLAALGCACGASAKQAKGPAAVPADAGASATSDAAGASRAPASAKAMALPSGPARTLAPASSSIERRAHPQGASCHSESGDTSAPAKVVADLVTRCAAATKQSRWESPLVGALGPADPPMYFPFRAEAGRCYRVYASMAPAVSNLVVVVQDDTGRPAAEYRLDDLQSALAPDESLCFRAAQQAQIVVSVGLGEGAFAVALSRD